jgi:hypothetical protein
MRLKVLKDGASQIKSLPLHHQAVQNRHAWDAKFEEVTEKCGKLLKRPLLTELRQTVRIEHLLHLSA